MKNSENVNIAEDGSIDISAKKRKYNRKGELKHIDNRSFLALLIRSFVSFTAIIVVAMVFLYLIAFWANDSDKINVDIRTIDNYKTELETGRYVSIPIERIFGKRGWLDIVDSDGNVVQSFNGAGEPYTLGEIDCILNFGSGESVRSLKFEESSGEYSYIVIKSFSNGAPDQYLRLNSQLAKTESSMPFAANKGQFTQREFDLLTYNSSHTNELMEKYAFVGRDGKEYYAIYLDANIDSGVSPFVFLFVFIAGIIIMMTVVVIFYIRYINRHVQRPLKALSAAMKEFANGGSRAKLTYRGAIEFEQLVDSFNEMVSLLNTSEEQRIALEQDKQRMLAGLSHDLKTPMTVIQGFSKAIKDGLVSEEDMPKYLNLILAKSEHMSELINEFYEYSKLDHPDFNLSLNKENVSELVRTYFANRYDEFNINDRALDADITEDELFIEADKAQITRVLDNLVNNFFKYTPPSSTLFVQVKGDYKNAYISIGDDGMGIADSVKNDIFDPFVVGEQSRSNQGSGLGLAVCKKIVSAHNGTIALAKQPGPGRNVEFVITLPLYKEINDNE